MPMSPDSDRSVGEDLLNDHEHPQQPEVPRHKPERHRQHRRNHLATIHCDLPVSVKRVSPNGLTSLVRSLSDPLASVRGMSDPRGDDCLTTFLSGAVGIIILIVLITWLASLFD